MFTHGRKSGCRISLDYTYRDLKVAFLENETLRVGILVDKGADVFKLTYKPRNLDFLWQSPIPLRKPFVATSALPEGAFFDYYTGAGRKCFPRQDGPRIAIGGLLRGCTERFRFSRSTPVSSRTIPAR